MVLQSAMTDKKGTSNPMGDGRSIVIEDIMQESYNVSYQERSHNWGTELVISRETLD